MSGKVFSNGCFPTSINIFIKIVSRDKEGIHSISKIAKRKEHLEFNLKYLISDELKTKSKQLEI